MSQLDGDVVVSSGPYFRSFEDHLETALWVYSQRRYALFCYMVATAAEMAGGGLLILEQIEADNDAIRNKYGHSVRGIFERLAKADVVTDKDADDIFTVVVDANLSERSRGRKYEQDYGANIFKFPYKHMQRGWPTDWVDKEYAETIFQKVVPVLQKMLASLQIQ